MLEAGHRVILPDLPGFGRSDKPMDEDWYSYDRHVGGGDDAARGPRPARRDVRPARLGRPDRPAARGRARPTASTRLVLMDTGLFTGEQPMSEAWHRFADFVERVEELPVGLLVRRGCATDPGDEVAAAYDAPFPSEASKAGARAFPAILPLQPDAPGRGGGPPHARGAARGPRPTLMLWGAEDPAAAAARGRGVRGRARAAGAARDRGRRPLPPGGPGASRSARLIADWLRLLGG